MLKTEEPETDARKYDVEHLLTSHLTLGTWRSVSATAARCCAALSAF
jgi:hypothetical protein